MANESVPDETLQTEGNLERSGSVLQRAGSNLQRASTNLQFQRAGTLPTEDKDLRHAATMPMMFDVEAERPWCGGLWKTQQFVGFLLGIAMLIGFCIARPMKTYPSANDMLGITSLCAAFWVFEVIPIYMTALFPLVLMPFFKVTSSEIAAQAYWSWVSLLVVGTYLVDIALEHVHLPRRIALRLLLKLGVVHPAALLACFMFMSWALAMFINSIAVTLLMTPFAIGLMNAAEEQVRNTYHESESGVDSVTQEADMSSRTREVQKFADGLLLGIAYSATSGSMATLTGAIANYFLAGETNFASSVTWGRWFAFALPISVVTLILAYGVIYFRYVRYLRFQGIEHEVLVAEHDDLVHQVGKFSRDEAIVGCIQILQVVLLIIRPFAVSPLFRTEYGSNLINDATLACIPALLLFFVPSATRPGQALLTWPVVHEKFDFGLLLLIGGGLAINSGFTQSGLNTALGNAVASMIPHMPAVLFNFVIILCVTLCSQIFSNVGTAAAMLPVLGSAALEAVVNPLSILLPATIATSFAFVLPTATPPNVVVLAKSQDLPRALRIRDFFYNGLPLTLIACIVGALLTHVLGQAVFDSESPFPRWACDASAGSCIWANVSGVVQGNMVDAQACIVDLGPSSNGNFCQLWNGTRLDTLALTPQF